MLDVELEAAVASREHCESFESGGDNLGADAVAGNGCNSVFAHV
jgi:hypothetical protein